MATSAWTPVDETPSAASAWTPVEEPKAAPAVSRESTPEYQDWKQKRAAFEAMPVSKRLWMMATQPNSVPDPNGPANVPGSFEGHPENIGQYPVATVGRAAEGMVDMSRGNVAMGLHKEVQAAGNAIAPMAPLMAVGAPVTALRALGGGVVGSKVAGAVANASGASEDQKALAEDAGNIVGGGVAATGAIRAFLGSPTRALLTKAAGAADGVVSDDLLGIISPRALHGLRMLRAAAKIAGTSEDSAGLSEIAAKHTDAITAKEQELNDALSKANALSPEGPATTVKPGFDDATQTYSRPSKMGTPQGIQDMLTAAKAGEPVSTRVDAHKVTKTAIGEQVSSTPNATIYNEPMQEKTAQQIYAEKFLQKSVPKPTLLDQLKQWDQIRQIHSQLEDQIGQGQDELQQWMSDHNQEAPGAKPASAAATAKAWFDAARARAVPGVPDEPRVPTSDADMENLLMKSVQNAKAKKAMSAKAGD